MGLAASMAAVCWPGRARTPLLAAQHPDPHPPGERRIQRSGRDIQIHAQEILRVSRRIDEILSHHTGKPIEWCTGTRIATSS